MIYLQAYSQEETKMSKITHVDEKGLQEAINNNQLVLVDFFATWCGPCKMLTPELEKLAEDMGDKVAIVKVDIDKSPELARQFDVFSVPTLFVFENGQVARKSAGYQPAEKLKQLLGN